MPISYLEAPGFIIAKDTLRITKAKEVLAAVENLPFYCFVECRRRSDLNEGEIIVFDTEVQVGQRRVHDIRNIERIAVIFYASDDFMPEVLALREDFPLVPHTNLRLQEKPRSLCLYEQSYDEIKLRWTATFFLEQIRYWLALTAKGELHGVDQPLEPLLSETSNYLIFPFDYVKNTEGRNSQFMIIRRKNSAWIVDHGVETFIPLPLLGKPQTAGIISKQPKNVAELDDFLKYAGIALLSELRNKLKIIKEQNQKSDIFKIPIVAIAYLPKKRATDSEPEASDVWAFLIKSPISTIGKEIGIWDISEGNIAYLIKHDSSKSGQNLEIEILNTMPSFTREMASFANGQRSLVDTNILSIGAGALGSQIIINLVRMGIGQWTIVDEDCLLPHNLARHALPGFFMGGAKAEKLAEMANSIIQGSIIAKAIDANLLHPSTHADALLKAVEEAQVIFDFSASIPVARHLARDVVGNARRVSAYLNPSGSDVVILSEDKNRKITLDCLEMQYYRYLINEQGFEEHLKPEDDRIRYARSCRDVSSTMPQDLVALHAAICSRKINKILSEDNESSITIWRADTDSLSVKKSNVSVYEMLQRTYGGWTLCFDYFIMNKIQTARTSKLPNETGGVLLGSFDMSRKIIYIVDTFLSPPDSIERAASYERGREGLKEKLSKIEKITLGNLTYIGEWHSHPKGYSTAPSADDVGVFAWLLEIMSTVGLPPLMLISGGHGESWHVERI